MCPRGCDQSSPHTLALAACHAKPHEPRQCIRHCTLKYIIVSPPLPCNRPDDASTQDRTDAHRRTVATPPTPCPAQTQIATHCIATRHPPPAASTSTRHAPTRLRHAPPPHTSSATALSPHPLTHSPLAEHIELHIELAALPTYSAAPGRTTSLRRDRARRRCPGSRLSARSALRGPCWPRSTFTRRTDAARTPCR